MKNEGIETQCRDFLAEFILSVGMRAKNEERKR